jgi:hypothetical protein
MHKYTFLSVTVALSLQACLASAGTLLSEGFDAVTLQPFESPTEQGGDGTDWSPGLPAGWTMTFSGPQGNPIEFQGWRVMDVDSWIATEGDQDRSKWTNAGVGAHDSVLVADPDAYDDATNIDDALFNTYIHTPTFDLGSLAPSTVSISFDSFWRNEETQKGSLDVSFDGGATFSNLMKYDSSQIEDGLVIDERLTLAVNNPGSGSLQFRFGLTEGSNDWWWAIDDVLITADPVPEPSTFALGALGIAGYAFLRRRK